MNDEAIPSPVGLSAKQREKVNFIWSVKETLRDHYKRHQYQEVILPFCVLRRLDCVLEPTKDAVVAKAGVDRLHLGDASAAGTGSGRWRCRADPLRSGR